MDTVLGGHPLLSGQLLKPPNLFPLFTFYNSIQFNLYLPYIQNSTMQGWNNEIKIMKPLLWKQTPLLSGRGHLKST